MAERAGIFDNGDDLDVSGFTPKKPVKSAEPPSEAVRAVSESMNFKSREPAASSAPKAPAKRLQRRRRTGRNLQLNLKVAAKTLESFYEVTDRQGWVLGETLEKALAALQRELAAQK
jgi:hypothetical protein